jgi:hypothetical protein
MKHKRFLRDGVSISAHFPLLFAQTMDIQITLNRESHIILAEGYGRRWNFWNLSALGILLGLAVAIGGLWYALSRPIPIPSDTAILGVISPKAAKQLIADHIWEKIPAICQDLLSTDSDWPVICGLTTSGQSFAIAPRWIQGRERVRFTAGLAARSGEVVGETRPFRYTSALAWRGLAKQPAIELQSSAIEKWLGLETPSTSTSILFRWNGRGFESDLKLPPQTSPLPAGDIALAITGSAWEGLPGELFLDASNLPDRKQWKPLPAIERYAVWLGPDRLIQGRYVGFAEPLNQETAARILGMSNVTERRSITLPDGSVSFERLLPTASTSTNLFGKRISDRGELIELEPRFMLVSNASTTLDQSNIAPCGITYPWLRLSQTALADIIEPSLPSLQAFSQNGHLAICFE